MATKQVDFGIGVHQSGKTKASAFSRFLNKYFYFSMSLLIALLVVYGFSHTVNHNLIHATPPRPGILWIHGAVFSAWVVFFIFQSALVRTHNVNLHRLTGWFGAVLGVLVPVMGISAAIVMDRFDFIRLHQPGTYLFFSNQLLSMTSFTVLFGLAIYWRRKPEMHRRLVLIATCVLTAAAFSRCPWMPHHWYYSGVDGLILLGVVRDLIVNRRVHIVYRYALPILIACQILAVNLWVHHPAWWVRVTNAVMG